MPATEKIIAEAFVLFLLIFSVPYLNDEIAANGAKVGATTMDVFLASVFPMFLGIAIIAWVGMMIYTIAKEM